MNVSGRHCIHMTKRSFKAFREYMTMSDFWVIHDLSEMAHDDDNFFVDISVTELSVIHNVKRPVMSVRMKKLESYNVISRIKKRVFVNPTVCFIGTEKDRDLTAKNYIKMFGSCEVRKDDRSK